MLSTPLRENEIRVILRYARTPDFDLAGSAPTLSTEARTPLPSSEVTYDFDGGTSAQRHVMTAARFVPTAGRSRNHTLGMRLDGRCRENNRTLLARVEIEAPSNLPYVVLIGGRRVDGPHEMTLRLSCRGGVPVLAPNQSFVIRTRP